MGKTVSLYQLTCEVCADMGCSECAPGPTVQDWPKPRPPEGVVIPLLPPSAWLRGEQSPTVEEEREAELLAEVLALRAQLHDAQAEAVRLGVRLVQLEAQAAARPAGLQAELHRTRAERDRALVELATLRRGGGVA